MTKPAEQERLRIRSIVFPTIATAILLGLFVAILTVFIQARGVCCYDDACIAIVARNLAEGRGYTLPLNFSGSEYSLRAFDPLLGTGPTSILPVAGAIAIFGPQYWVPGGTHVFLEIVLLCLALWLLTRIGNHARIPFYLAAVIVLIGLVTARNVEYWSAQLGEAVAALLLLTGCLVWVTMNAWKGRGLVVGLLFGLAVLAKELAAICVLAFVCVAAVQRWQERKVRPLTSSDLRIWLGLVVGGFGPFFLFQIWQLWVLGPQQFRAGWREHLGIIQDLAGVPTERESLPRSLLKRVVLAKTTYFIGLPSILLLGALAFYLIRLRGGTKGAQLAALLAAGIGLHLLHWLFSSNDRARYLYIIVVLWCFLVALPILWSRWLGAIPAVCAIVIASLSSAHLHLARVVREMWTREARQNVPQRQLISYLDGELRGVPIYAAWWAHVASAQYFSSEPVRFQGGALEKMKENRGPVYVLVKSHVIDWLAIELDRDLLETLPRCGPPVFTAGDYKLFRCAPEEPSPLENPSS